MFAASRSHLDYYPQSFHGSFPHTGLLFGTPPGKATMFLFRTPLRRPQGLFSEPKKIDEMLCNLNLNLTKYPNLLKRYPTLPELRYYLQILETLPSPPNIHDTLEFRPLSPLELARAIQVFKLEQENSLFILIRVTVTAGHLVKNKSFLFWIEMTIIGINRIFISGPGLNLSS